jgi:hypothetical protein
LSLVLFLWSFRWVFVYIESCVVVGGKLRQRGDET